MLRRPTNRSGRLRRRLGRTCLALAAALTCVTCGSVGSVGTKGPARLPDVVLIVVDTLRADALGVYGNPWGLSPRMDALARSGLVFDRATSAAPWTQPSMASMFSGVYPGVHGVTSYLDALDAVYRGEPRVQAFDDRFVTLAEVLAGSGYETAGFVANPFLVEPFGFAQGFSHYDAGFARNTTGGDVVNEAARQWLAERGDSPAPLFLYVHYMDAHGPYEAAGDDLTDLLDRVEALPLPTSLSAEQRARLDYLDRPPADPLNAARHERLAGYREYWEARYDAGVRVADRHVGELLDMLDGAGIGEDAVVILTADHGESLGEHGVWDHGSTLFEPELHVPLAIRAPDLTPGRLHPRVATVDLMPTVLDLLGLEGRTPDEVQGRSILGGDLDEPGRPDAFAESISIGPEQKCVYEGDWKLLLLEARDAVALYEVDEDPDETVNAVAQNLDEARELRFLLDEQLEENDELRPDDLAPPVGLSPEQIERLEALGYL